MRTKRGKTTGGNSCVQTNADEKNHSSITDLPTDEYEIVLVVGPAVMYTVTLYKYESERL